MIQAETTLLHAATTDMIISWAYDVCNQLGFGFSEKVYENAMMIKLAQKGLTAAQQKPVNVSFEEQLVGEYVPDILADNRVIVELKAVSTILKAHEAQVLNYLKATDIKVGLLINFGDKLKIVRRVY